VIRIIVRCQRDKDHAKVLTLHRTAKMEWAETLIALLEGTSPMYFYPPGEKASIGQCAACGGKLKCEVSEGEGKNVI
jgi:hypothetical protein